MASGTTGRNVSPSGLELRQVTAGYGETVVLERVDLMLRPGESVSVIGRNGVGKTTLLSTIMGHTTLHSGEILLGEKRIDHLPIFRRALAGIGFVPQEREIFPSLTVEENMRIAARSGIWTEEKIFELFPNLAERRYNLGNQLSGGEQQMLAIARALLTNPTILLMDEPTEGLAPVIVDTLVAVMQQLRRESGLTMILVEQNSRVAFEFSERTIVMDKGAIAYDGLSAQLRADPERLSQLIGVAT
ncbi:MAG: ABC transporter ATP-binding protein [Hyphomicrobiaceae bacterium]